MQTVAETSSRRPTLRRARRAKTLNIVPAGQQDMGLIADFVRSSAEWYRPFVDEKDMSEHDVDDAWAEENFARRSFYIGLANHEPVGTISMQVLQDYAYLGYIYLDVEHVGQGYGQQLIRFAEVVARCRRLRGMALIAHPQAEWARRAYLKYGFEVTASSKDDVLAWQDGVLEPYYEEGFELYTYSFSEGASGRAD